MARKREGSMLLPVALVAATWLVTQLAKVVFKRNTPPGTRAQVRERREQSSVYSILLAGALALTEFAVTRLLSSPVNERD